MVEMWNYLHVLVGCSAGCFRFSFACSSRMATDKALSLSIDCSTADADRSCSYPKVEMKKKKKFGD